MRDMEDLMQSYMADNHMFNMEGGRGVNNLEKICKEVCGYDSLWAKSVLHSFLEDNPGAIEAVLTWISEQHNTEWQSNLEQMVEPEDADSEEGDDTEASDAVGDDRDFVVRGFQ